MSRINTVNEEVITLVILFSIFILMIGNMFSEKDTMPANIDAGISPDQEARGQS